MYTGYYEVQIPIINAPILWGSLDFTPGFQSHYTYVIETRSQEEIDRERDLILERVRASEKARQQVLQKAEEVIARCRSAEIKDPTEKSYLKDLAGYLEKRKTEALRFHETDQEQELQIKTRTDFIVKVIDAVIDRDQKRECELLQEKNIKVFKGWWSKRLYNLLCERRTNLEKQAKISKEKCQMELEAGRSIKNNLELSLLTRR